MAAAEGSRFAPWRAEARAVAVLGGPLILTQLAQMAMPTTDILLIGYLGDAPLAAASLAHTVHVFAWLIGLGPASAVAPIIAQILGAHPSDRARTRASLRMGLWSILLLSPLLCLPLFFAEPMLLALGQSPELARLAGPYAQVLALSVPLSLAFNVLRNFATALSRPNLPLFVLGVAVLLNAVLGYGLIFGGFGMPEIGLIGAAWATTISNLFIVVALVLVLTLARSFRSYRVWRRFHRPDWVRLAEVFRLGFSIGVNMVFEVALFAGATLLVGRFGTAALAAHQVALNIASVVFMVPLGLAIAATVRVGMAAGAGDLAGVRRAGFSALAIGVTFMLGTAALFLIFPRELVSLYLDVDDPANEPAVALAVSFLKVAAAFAIFDGAQVLMNMSLRGLKDVTVPMWIAGLSYWLVGLPLTVFFGFGLGLEGFGIWLGFAAGLFLAAALMLLRFAHLSGTWALFRARAPRAAGRRGRPAHRPRSRWRCAHGGRGAAAPLRWRAPNRDAA
jgi:MATE family multidrug resistance protein